MKTKKFIAWGFRKNTNTFHYIMLSYLKAFEYLGYDVYHFDNSDDVSGFDFSNCIFFTEGQVDQNIPILKDAIYILHNCNFDKYKNLNHLGLQVYIKNDTTESQSGVFLDTHTLYNEDDNVLYQPWATDLLPDEIERDLIVQDNKISSFVGLIWSGHQGNDTQIVPYTKSCEQFGYEFKYYPAGSCSFEENRNIIASSEIAPTITGSWQTVQKYIPCRIFKNVSYGKLGITNSKAVRDIMEGNVIYNENPEYILEDYLSVDLNDQKKMFSNSSKLIFDKHTYLNRINSIMRVFADR